MLNLLWWKRSASAQKQIKNYNVDFVCRYPIYGTWYTVHEVAIVYRVPSTQTPNTILQLHLLRVFEQMFIRLFHQIEVFL